MEENDRDVNADDTARITFADLGIKTNSQLVDSPLGLGKRREWKDLQIKEYIFMVTAALCLLAVISLTIYRLGAAKTNSVDFTFSIILLISSVACACYLVEGLLQERPHEIMALVISTVAVWLYIILNFALGVQTAVKMARLIVCSIMSPVLIVIGTWIAKHYYDSGRLIFRTVGANNLMQEMCKVLFAFYGLLKFDLQLSLCMVVLILTNGSKIDTEDIVVLAVGGVITIASFVIGFLSVKKENKILAIIYAISLAIQPAYILFKTITSAETVSSKNDSLSVPTFVCAAIAISIRGVLVVYFIRCWLNFGKGLKEKVYSTGTTEQIKQNTGTNQNSVNNANVPEDTPTNIQ